MDITVAQRPWPQNASASPVRIRIAARRYRISGEVMIPGSAAIARRFDSDYKKTARAFSVLVAVPRLPAAEHVVGTFGDFPDRAFIDYPGADDVLPHLLVRDAGQGRLDVGRFLEGHHEAVRQLAPDLVRDAGRPLVDEGEDEIELPRLAGEAAERVRVRRDLRAQELVGLLEEQDETREFLVPLGVQLEEAAGKDVRDEEVHHLVRAVVPEVEDDALLLPDRGEDMVERVLSFLRLLEEGESVQPPDSALQALQRHLVGPLRPEDLHRGLFDRRDQVPPRTALCDLVQGVDHRRRE